VVFIDAGLQRPAAVTGASGFRA